MCDHSEFFDVFLGDEIVVATAAARMLALALTPEDVLRLYDERMAAVLATMTPATPELQERVAGRAAERGSQPAIPLGPGERFMRRRCPRCGEVVVGKELCPRVSPHWRVQLACDACGWSALSALRRATLERLGYAGHVKED